METVAIKTVLEITSPAFNNEGWIPKEHSCEGKGTNPALGIDGIPADAKSLAIIVEDQDAPGGAFTHWLVWNIPPSKKISEHSKPGEEGNNGRGTKGWIPPCPPSGAHRYFFKVYALDKVLNIDQSFDKPTLEHAMEGHVVAYGELMGKYEKGRN